MGKVLKASECAKHLHVGDEVRAVGYHPCYKLQGGNIVKVTKINGSSVSFNCCAHSFDDWSVEVISSKKSFMGTLIESFKLAIKGEPERSFIKAGVTDANGNLTSEGKELFVEYLLRKNADDFKKEVVDVVLAEKDNK